MRKTLFLIIKFLSRFLNKLMISRYTTMFYNNVTLYRKVLFWLKTCKEKKEKWKKKNIQDQCKWKTQADCANYSTERRLHILESAYMYCVYIVSRINSERNSNIHMLGWKFAHRDIDAETKYCAALRNHKYNFTTTKKNAEPWKTWQHAL